MMGFKGEAICEQSPQHFCGCVVEGSFICGFLGTLARGDEGLYVEPGLGNPRRPHDLTHWYLVSSSDQLGDNPAQSLDPATPEGE